MGASETQILNQVNVNYDAIDKLAAEMGFPHSKAQESLYQNKMAFLWKSQQYWATEYQRTTGKPLILLAPTTIVGNVKEELAEQARLSLSKTRAEDAIYQVDQEYQRLRLLLQDQYDIATTWQNALFSDMVRLGVGLDARHPLTIKKQVEDRTGPALQQARAAMLAGDYDKAFAKAVFGGSVVKWGFDRLGDYMTKLDVGGARAIAGIKISASLATLIAAAPFELGVLGAAGIGALGEGSQQITTIVAKGLDPGYTVSTADLKNAVLATAVAGFSAGAGKGLGKLAAKGLALMVARKLVEGEPTQKAIEFIAARIENYVAANAYAISNKMLKLDTTPDWNWWYMAIAPMINGVAMEMTKEPDFNAIMKK